MKRIFVFVVVFLLGFGFSSTWAQDGAKCLVRVSGLESKEIKAFMDGGSDIAARGNDWLEMVVSQDELAMMKKAGRRVRAMIPDLDAYVKQRLDMQTVEAKYRTCEEVASTLQNWAASWPSILRIESIGKSHEGRDIWAVKLSQSPSVDTKKTAVLLMGAHHAREWTSFEVPMSILETLLRSYGKNERLTRLVNERELWFVPVVNPDGVTYSQKGAKFWRKNRRPMANNAFGVDLNRNYDYHWAESGVSSSPSGETYPGPKGFSEPEIFAIKVLAEREQFQASLSFHSYSQLVLYPFAYAYNVPNPEEAVYKDLGKQMAVFNKYKVQNCTELYPAAGISDDWLYGVLKTLAFTFEMGREFIPAPAEIASQCALNVPAALVLIEQAAAAAVNVPSGDPALVGNLDFADGMAALNLGQRLMPNYSGDSREWSASRLMGVARRTASLATERILDGDEMVLRTIKNSSAASTLVPLVRSCLRFESCHGRTIPASVFEQLPLSR
ncbi:MAG: M14 family metallopeptidase [Candidatus Ozemobacteraceae bacterium]